MANHPRRKRINYDLDADQRATLMGIKRLVVIDVLGNYSDGPVPMPLNCTHAVIYVPADFKSGGWARVLSMSELRRSAREGDLALADAYRPLYEVAVKLWEAKQGWMHTSPPGPAGVTEYALSISASKS